MSTNTEACAPGSAPVRVHAIDASHLAVTQRRVIRAEWIKFRSVRSLPLGLAAAFAVAVGFGVLFSSFAGSRATQGGEGPMAGATDPVSLSLAGFNLAVLIVGVLGVLIVTSEYSSGLIRATLSAVPRRVPVLIAKAVVFAVIVVAAMAVAALVAFLGGQAVYSGSQASASLADAGVIRAVLGTAVYTTGAGLIGVALGFLLRSAAAAIGVLIAVLLIAPGLAGLLPGSIGENVPKFLPSNAASAFTTVQTRTSLLSAGAGAAVLALWVLAMLIAAAVALKYRDV